MSVTYAPPSATNHRRPGGTSHDGAPPRPHRAEQAPPTSSRWARPALIALLVATAVAYLWGLDASGDANSFYAAAVQAGTKSWKAFFFGSIDPSNFITVDKPPASLWVMEVSGRIFGFSSWSMLAPQALEGVAAVALVYAGVRRWFGAWAGLLAGTLLATTPVAALMFRFNNPDALLTLLMVAAAYTLIRAVEGGSRRWVVATGTLLGFAFLAKMLQAFTVVPAMAAVYALAAPVGLRKRIGHLLLGAVAVVVSAGWWVAIVALWPASSRPMIDGSSSNSIINLILGYNGLGRLYSRGGGGQGGNFSGATGALRLFNSLMGGQASWLIPAALLAALAGLAWRGRAPRTDRTRAALLLWGGWLVVTGAVFSLGQGVIHTYYTVALAPATAALVAIGASMVWRQRSHLVARALGAAGIAGSAWWASALLHRSSSYHPWLHVAVLAAGIVSGVALLASPLAGRLGHRVAAASVGLGLLACVSGPAAFAATTISTAHTGSIPSAGPAVAGGGFGSFGGFGGGAQRAAGAGSASGSGGGPGFGGAPPAGGFAPPSGTGTPSTAARGGSFPGGGSAPSGSAPTGTATGSASPGSAGLPTGGAPGGGGSSTSSALVAALRADAGSYRWVAATLGSQSAASLELSSGEPVMAIGGFSGQGGNLSLATFESYVAKGDIHYFIASGGGGAPGGRGSDGAITSWVAAHYSTTTIGGQTVYDLAVAAR